MTEETSLAGDVYRPAPEVIASAYIPDYDEVYAAATADLTRFWRKIASEDFEWYQPWENVLDESNAPFYRWFVGAKVNVIHNALDRHLRTDVRNKAAIIFEGEPGDCRVFTYQQLNHEVCKFASVLRAMGVGKGDLVTIFMGRIPEQIVAMLACAKVGAIHSVVDSGLTVDALRRRIETSQSKVLITCDGAWSRGNIVDLKSIANEAVRGNEDVRSLICVRRTKQEVEMVPGRDYWYDEMMALPIANPRTYTEVMDADDPLFILFGDEGTEQPKAVVHAHGGYMVGCSTTLKWVFDIKPADVWWCAFDPGHIAGHGYLVYGPLMLGATCFMYEGVATYPYPDRWWQMVARYAISKLYTSPAEIRNLMRFGENWPRQHDLSSLRLLGVAGETIEPEVWKWFYRVIGGDRCPIMDTWLQPETGSFVLAPLPSLPLKPGSPARPFPGIEADVVDEEGKSLPDNELGNLVLKSPWPAMLCSLYGETDLYVERYWERFKDQGWYSTCWRARKDADGYFWLARENGLNLQENDPAG